MAQNAVKNENDMTMAEVFEAVGEDKLREGQLVKGEVVDITDTCVKLNIGEFTEGTIYLEYYTKDDQIKSFNDILKLGDLVEAKVSKIIRDEHVSEILLTRLPLLINENLDKVEKAFEEQKVIKVVITDVLEKGLICQYQGVKLFLPLSLLDPELQSKKQELKGKTLEVIIVKYVNKGKRPNIIVSRKPIIKEQREKLYQERQEKKEKALAEIKQGDVLNVEVVKILKNSVEVAIDEFLHGQIRISQIAHEHIDNIEDYVKVGDKFQALVLEKKGRRIDLSKKFLLPTPFELFTQEHKVGDVIEALVENKVEKGLILKLRDNLTCFMSMYELSWNPKNNFEAFFKIGEPLKVKITKIDLEDTKIQVSRKQLEENPWQNVDIKVGDKVEVVVLKAQDNGSGLDVDFNLIQGFIPKGNLDKKLEEYQPGEKLTAIVLKVTPSKWDLVLSVKEPKQKIQKEEKPKVEKEVKKEEVIIEEDDERATIGDFFKKENLK